MTFQSFLDANKEPISDRAVFDKNEIPIAFDNINYTLYAFFEDGLYYFSMTPIPNGKQHTVKLVPDMEHFLKLNTEETIAKIIGILNDLITGSNFTKMPWMQLIKDENGNVTGVNSEVPLYLVDQAGEKYLN